MRRTPPTPLAVENAVYIANELDIPLLYISTAGIFDGRQDVYDDWDAPNPLGVYARAKWAGEEFVKQNARRYLVCRAGWMMGGGPRKDKKFIQKLMQQLRDGATELNVVDDKLGTPTYTRDFAHNVRASAGERVLGSLQHGLPGRDQSVSRWRRLWSTSWGWPATVSGEPRGLRLLREHVLRPASGLRTTAQPEAGAAGARRDAPVARGAGRLPAQGLRGLPARGSPTQSA